MLAAVWEWFIGLAAFIYCFVKVYQKADQTSTKILAVLNIAFFTVFR
jgi:chitin synthase